MKRLRLTLVALLTAIVLAGCVNLFSGPVELRCTGQNVVDSCNIGGGDHETP